MAKYTVKIIVEGVEAPGPEEAEELVREALNDEREWELEKWGIFVVANDEPDDEFDGVDILNDP